MASTLTAGRLLKLGLCQQDRQFLDRLIAGEELRVTERERHARLARIVAAVTRSGASAALLSALGLDLVSLGLALRQCIAAATRPGRGKRGAVECADYATRHAAIRTALELQRQLGPRASRREERAATPRPVAASTSRRALALLGDESTAEANPELATETPGTATRV